MNGSCEIVLIDFDDFSILISKLGVPVEESKVDAIIDDDFGENETSPAVIEADVLPEAAHN